MATQFEIIESQNVEEFKKAVNKHLNEGWGLHGGMKSFPYILRNSGDVDTILYIQALIKEENKVFDVAKD